MFNDYAKREFLDKKKEWVSLLFVGVVIALFIIGVIYFPDVRAF